ncbi:hypothetical protein, partial [Corynebacterium stationis]|uniref:hypothetical protein n=2 Tax=Corynebacterium stationis TaxID=1705 RepID=UPI00263AA68E
HSINELIQQCKETRMTNRIDNLGDYNLAREMVKHAGGSLDKALEKVVTEATPALLRKGQVQGALVTVGAGGVLLGTMWVGKKLINSRKPDAAQLDDRIVQGAQDDLQPESEGDESLRSEGSAKIEDELKSEV